MPQLIKLWLWLRTWSQSFGSSSSTSDSAVSADRLQILYPLLSLSPSSARVLPPSLPLKKLKEKKKPKCKRGQGEDLSPILKLVFFPNNHFQVHRKNSWIISNVYSSSLWLTPVLWYKLARSHFNPYLELFRRGNATGQRADSWGWSRPRFKAPGVLLTARETLLSLQPQRAWVSLFRKWQ